MARKECEAKQWFLMWNMAVDTHLWHPALSPPAYLRKQVASCTPSGRGVPEKQMCGRRWRKLTTLRINEAVVSLRGSWQEGWTGVWPAADSSPWSHSDRLWMCFLCRRWSTICGILWISCSSIKISQNLENNNHRRKPRINKLLASGQLWDLSVWREKEEFIFKRKMWN